MGASAGDYGVSEGAEAVPSLMGLISNENQKFCRYDSGSIVCDLGECTADSSCVFQTQIQEDNTIAMKSMSENKWCDVSSNPPSKTRLVDSSGNPQAGNTGMLQMELNGIWKYVCDDDFDGNNNGASVACRELGYTTGSHSDGVAHDDKLFYDNVVCSGAESSLADCPRGNGENCAANEAVTLSCGTARLVDSSGNPQVGNTGLLQMKVSSTWKYVCDDIFDGNNNGVGVACREMGFAGGSQSDGTTNSDDLFYDSVACTGTETSLADCPHASSAEDCAAGEGVTLTCTTQSDKIKCATDVAAEARKFTTSIYLSEYAAEILPTKAKYEGKAISMQALGGGFCYTDSDGKVVCNNNGDPHKVNAKFTVVVYDAEQGVMVKTADKAPAGIDEDCALEAIKGQVYYAFRNSVIHLGSKYCYKLTIGGSIGQDTSSTETACNANGYSQDYLVGDFAENTSPTEETFTNGDSCGSDGNRNAVVKVHQDPTATTTSAVVVEDPVCTYSVVITTPACE